jgi:hypothetical protein
MPQSQPLSAWLTAVVDWPSSLMQWFGSQPEWVLLLLLFIPSVVAVAMRLWHLLAAVLMLNALIALSAAAWPAGELRTLGIGLASALILAFIGQGIRQRARDDALAALQARADAMDGRIGGFLAALDRRAQIADENAIELAKNRLRNEAAGRPAARAEPPKP